jgi:hypothetical protein
MCFDHLFINMLYLMAAQMALYVHGYVFRTQKMCGQTSNDSANDL